MVSSEGPRGRCGHLNQRYRQVVAADILPNRAEVSAGSVYITLAVYAYLPTGNWLLGCCRSVVVVPGFKLFRGSRSDRALYSRIVFGIVVRRQLALSGACRGDGQNPVISWEVHLVVMLDGPLPEVEQEPTGFRIGWVRGSGRVQPRTTQATNDGRTKLIAQSRCECLSPKVGRREDLPAV